MPIEAFAIWCARANIGDLVPWTGEEAARRIAGVAWLDVARFDGFLT
jgi:hypothetical protein